MVNTLIWWPDMSAKWIIINIQVNNPIRYDLIIIILPVDRPENHKNRGGQIHQLKIIQQTNWQTNTVKSAQNVCVPQ